MAIILKGASEHNLKDIDVRFDDGLTVVTGVSGSGKSSLVFDTLYHESRRRYLEAFGRSSDAALLNPAKVRSISGLGPAIAVGQNLLNRNPSSTLATASGIHPLLRVLYARFGSRYCPDCGVEVKILSVDEVVERLFSLSRKAAVDVRLPLVNNAYGTHHTLLTLISKQHEADDIFVDGLAYTGKLAADKQHDISIRIASLSGDGTRKTAREIVNRAVTDGAAWISIETNGNHEQLSFSPVCTRCGCWLREVEPKHFHMSCGVCGGSGHGDRTSNGICGGDGAGCGACGGTGLPADAAKVRWNGLLFTEFLQLAVKEAGEIGKKSPDKDLRILQEINGRLRALQDVGLGYIALDRSSPTLSRGESQRLRLALALTGKLEDMVHILDEPTVGQHPWDVQRLLPVFRELPGPVIFVEHDRDAALFADRAVDLGPGAGDAGGQVLYSGDVKGLLEQDSETGRYFSGDNSVSPAVKRNPVDEYVKISGACLRYLRDLDVQFPIGRITAVTGVSGSGKSTLVRDVLYKSLVKGKAEGCRAVDGLSLKPVLVDQSPIGVNPRSNPATYTKLFDTIRSIFADETDLSPSHFSFNTREGACEGCGGLGALEVTMRYLPSTWITCSQCDGQRYSDFVLDRRISLADGHFSIADILACTVSELRRLFGESCALPAAAGAAPRATLLRLLELLEEVGLGYLRVGQPSPSLSGGEAQRIKLVKFLGRKKLAGTLILMDEPSTGLHPHDIAGLLSVLDKLVLSGATVVVVEHNTDIINAADWIVDLGPGSGPDGGNLLHCGTLQEIQRAPGSLTAAALRNSEGVRAPKSSGKRQPKDRLEIRGARVNNLQNVSVSFPKGKLSVITGVSGSGKSSLVTDVIETEAKRRFLESLSFYERQSIREGAEVEVDEVRGLGVTFSIGAGRMGLNLRADVGSLSGLTRHIAVLLSMSGTRTCGSCQTAMQRRSAGWVCPGCGETAKRDEPRFFIPSTYASACPTCHGVGTHQVQNPEKLILHPELPLCAGAMYSPGFFPKGYLCKPYNGGYYLVQALAERYGFDPSQTPWQYMSKEAQQAFLYGAPEPLTVHYENKKGGKTVRTQRYDGFYGWVRDWDVGGTYTDTEKCSECGGARFRPEFLHVTLDGANVHELREMALSELHITLQRLSPGAAAGIEFQTDIPLSVSASLKACLDRLQFLQSVGLGYLNLNQLTSSLSAGEVQRLRIAGLLGSDMSSMTVLLDEPCRGLHPSEIDGLIDALRALAEQGQTVLVIEHELDVMRAADYIVEVGPGPGKLGGKIVYCGSPAEIGDTATGRWLNKPPDVPDGTAKPPIPTFPRASKVPQREWLRIEGAAGNNLKDVDLVVPTGVLTGICGVSGSGKSTLMVDTLGRIISPKMHTTSIAYEEIQPCSYKAIHNAPDKCIIVDQAKAGITNPADYMGLESIFRKLYLDSIIAEKGNLKEGDLRRNCTACGGRGFIRTNLAFLPPLHTPCDVCNETGYTGEVLEVRLRDKNLAELFVLTVDEARELWADNEKISIALAGLADVGLGYLLLRQPAFSLSGGEVQRIKIARELAKKAKGRTLYLLDEPTIGLHMNDVSRFAAILQNLSGGERSVAVIEHHPWLLSRCDWLIELGPAGGPGGGRIIAEGTPAEISAGTSPTAPYIHEALQISGRMYE